MGDTTFGYLFTMRAKPGRGPELRALLTSANGDSPDVESWFIGSQDDDDDSLVGFEFYASSEAAAQHDQNPGVGEMQARVGALLADVPTRHAVHPTATSLALLRP